MALSRIATVIGGLLLSKSGRGFAGRHAGKLALATLAYELWQSRRTGTSPNLNRAGRQSQTGAQAQGHPRQRWSRRSR
ncbi:cysteine protease [Brevundimonas sp.]|uniref:cysteine protease n=1 Tax=Brevundimonas sp. TaxID=1871086 RepID=UPI00286BBACF|nr:cysteine protease [Brevundimonas sp.]